MEEEDEIMQYGSEVVEEEQEEEVGNVRERRNGRNRYVWAVK